MDAHRVQRVLDLVRHARGQPAEGRELLRIRHQRLDGADRVEVPQREHASTGALAVGDAIARHRQLTGLPVGASHLHGGVSTLDTGIEQLGDHRRQRVIARKKPSEDAGGRVG